MMESFTGCFGDCSVFVYCSALECLVYESITL